MKKKYLVRGMSCAACSARVEDAVSHLEGVTACSVNLLTGEMLVLGEVSPDDVIACAARAGYGAALAAESGKTDTGRGIDGNFDDGSAKILKRFLLSLLPMLLLMYVSMGRMILLPLPAFLASSPLLVGIVQLVLSGIVILINRRFFISGFKGAIHLAPNMDTLVSLGSLASYLYSVYKLALIAIEPSVTHLHDLYFEAAAMILVLISLGKFLEAKAKGKTTDAIRSLLMLAPKEATLLVGDTLKVVSADEVCEGDIFVLRAGDRIPTDGVVISGEGSVDASMLTGESIPVYKGVGDEVSAATAVNSGYLTCRATRVGEGTTLASIIRMVKDAAASKAPIAKLADRVSGVFVPVVLAVALCTLFGWLIAGEAFGFALARAVSVLVISCPCALGLATPVAIMVGSGVGARRGILYKNATALEMAGRIKTVVLDKTGTITKGEMSVTDIIPINISEDELLSLAYSLEYKSEHPLARAIVDYAEKRGIKRDELTDFMTLAGRGVSSKMGESVLYGVSYEYASELLSTDSVEERYAALAAIGKTPIVFIRDSEIVGIIALMDTPREDARSAVSALRSKGVRVVMLTGDNELTARAVADEVGIEEVVAGVLPDGKESVISRLLGEGEPVAMVGDGINDAPALTRADLGIAVGRGTDIAIDAADVVLVRSSLMDVVSALGIGRAALWNIRENLVWAFLYNCIGIPMAVGLFGLTLNPMFGALAMSLSSFTVVMNALRLNLWRPIAAKQTETTPQKEAITTPKEEIKMQRIMKVNGMMCPHCEARVKKVLEAIDGVESAVPSHKEGTVIVTLSAEVSDEALRGAVTAADYEVTDIE